MAYQVPQNVRTLLPLLAETVFAVEAWTKSKPPPRYDQLTPKVPSVPWRPVAASPVLSTAAFEIIRFLEIFIDNDTEGVALARRWNEINSDPTKYFQSSSGLSSADWRRGREGLEPSAAKFGAFYPESSNFSFVTQSPEGAPKDALSRMDFYDSCWEPLLKAYQFKQPGDPAAWSAFRDNLRTDQFADWPISKPVRSSAFIRQFTVDVLNACVGQRNGAIAAGDPLLQRAVLIELGENRHVGNKYTEQQAAQAVDNFIKAI